MSGVSGGSGEHVVHVVKARVGYIELPNGHPVVFAEFLELENHPSRLGMAQLDDVMGELATAVYESFTSPPSR